MTPELIKQFREQLRKNGINMNKDVMSYAKSLGIDTARKTVAPTAAPVATPTAVAPPAASATAPASSTATDDVLSKIPPEILAKLKNTTPQIMQQALSQLNIPVKVKDLSVQPTPTPSAPQNKQQVPVGARISTQKGSYQKTAQGWVDTTTNKVVAGAWPGYLNRQYQAVLAKRGITESVRPYHITISSRKMATSR